MPRQMIDTANNRLILASYLEKYDLRLEEPQLSLLLQHLDLVVEKNKVMNLTRIVDPHEAIIRHVVDSLLLLRTVERCASHGDERRFIDIGTGAGFPGIPLAIASSMNGLLIDSVGKKVNAVNEFIDALGLRQQIEGQHARAEEVAQSAGPVFDVVTARAVADLGVLVEYASPLLRMSGSLVVSKARVQEDELERGCKTGKIVGLSLVSRETHELPEDQGYREILTFVHDKRSKVKLPRPNGMAKKKPLV